MIYVDPIQEYPSGKWCHMWSDGNDEELDTFAQSIGLKKNWAQISRGAILKRFYHYDLRPSMRDKAIKKGAKSMPLKDYIKLVQS